MNYNHSAPLGGIAFRIVKKIDYFRRFPSKPHSLHIELTKPIEDITRSDLF